MKIMSKRSQNHYLKKLLFAMMKIKLKKLIIIMKMMMITNMNIMMKKMQRKKSLMILNQKMWKVKRVMIKVKLVRKKLIAYKVALKTHLNRVLKLNQLITLVAFCIRTIMKVALLKMKMNAQAAQDSQSQSRIH